MSGVEISLEESFQKRNIELAITSCLGRYHRTDFGVTSVSNPSFDESAAHAGVHHRTTRS